MVNPDYADGQEADHVGSVGGPPLEQRLRKTSRLDVRDFQFEDEEGRSDGEDTVAEGFGAVGVQRVSSLMLLLAFVG